MPINTNLTHVVGDYLPLSGGTLTGAMTVTDDILLKLGSTSDVVALLRSTSLAADAEVTDVIEGTSEHPGVAANSLIISNITNDGDILLLVSKAGNSQGVFWADGSTGDTVIMAASGQSVDVYIAGTKEIDYATGALTFQQSTTISAASGTLTINTFSAAGNIFFTTTDLNFGAASIDDAYLKIVARDNGVGLVEIERWAGGANPYILIGRDDTGVALNTVTDMCVLQAGGGTGNEATNFGFGLAVNLGNAASEVQKRGYFNWVLTDATDASEDVRLDIGLMAGGTLNLVAQISSTGVLDVDDTSGLTAAVVGLFDDYDDALVLRQGISERKREVLERLGIMRRKDTGSGWMVSVQPMLYLLAGGVYQTRQMVDGVEERVVVLEEANRILKEQNARLLAKVGG